MMSGIGVVLLLIAFMIAYAIALYDPNNERR